MLFQYLLTASFAVFTAVLVVRVSTTPEARLRYLGQLDTASKLSDVAHEIQFHSPFSEQVSPEFATNLKLPTVTLHPRASSSQRYIVGTSPVVPKLLIQFLDHLNYISTSRIGTPRKISGFVRIQSPWPLVKYWSKLCSSLSCNLPIWTSSNNSTSRSYTLACLRPLASAFWLSRVIHLADRPKAASAS